MAKRFKLNRSSVHIKRAFISQFGMFFRDKSTAFWTGLIFLALSIVAGWIPDGLEKILFEKDKRSGIFLFISGLIILIVLGYLGVKYSHESKFEVYDEEPEKKKILIPFLSVINKGENIVDSQTLLEEIEKIPDNLPLEEKIEVIQQNSLLRKWRMPIEAIKYHQPKLEKIIVITSSQSLEQVPAFKELVKKCFGESFEKKIVKKLVSDFENIKELFNVLDDVYSEIRKEGYRDKDAIIDITGGQKINSIAGAFMTSFYNDREFQYVSTQNHKIKSYDVRLIVDD
ncbi:MAG: hypothetical protein ABGX27_08180 [Desulfurobacteriaceae bacterium]